MSVSTYTDAAFNSLVANGHLMVYDHLDNLELYVPVGTNPEGDSYRGLIKDARTGQVVAYAPQEPKDVVLSDTIISELRGENVLLCPARQVSRIRAFTHDDKLYVTTTTALSVHNSYWGINNRSFADMIGSHGFEAIKADILSQPKGKVLEYQLECPDNQFVTQVPTAYDGVSTILWPTFSRGPGCITYSGFVSYIDDYINYPHTVDPDVYVLDPLTNTRYLSVTFYNKLHKLRNPNEPNLLRRLFILKAHAYELLSYLPKDQHNQLYPIYRNKNQIIKMMPPASVGNPGSSNDNVSYFNKLHGKEQYELFKKYYIPV